MENIAREIMSVKESVHTIHISLGLNTANSIKVDVDNSQMCNMQRQTIMALITVSHANVKIYHTKYYICNPVRPPMC